MEKLFHKNIGKITFIVCLPLILAFATQKAHGFDENGDRLCLAQNIYFESANQPFAGRVAVANVAVNRSKDAQFPSTICDVVYQAKLRENWKGNMVPIRNKCQFSWYCDGKIDALYLTNAKGEVIKGNMQAWTDSLQIAEDSIRGNITDITLGATHYFNPDLADPYWAYHYTKLTEIESHDFYIHY